MKVSLEGKLAMIKGRDLKKGTMKGIQKKLVFLNLLGWEGDRNCTWPNKHKHDKSWAERRRPGWHRSRKRSPKGTRGGGMMLVGTEINATKRKKLNGTRGKV